MNQQPLLYGIIGLLAGSLITVFIASNAVNNNNVGMMQMMGMRNQDQPICPMDKEFSQTEEKEMMGMGSSMDDMMESMRDKTGDDFDKTFIEAMIIHHQGAIEMAKEAQNKATRQEIKDLSGDITSAQSKEIEMMRNWQNQWGY